MAVRVRGPRPLFRRLMWFAILWLASVATLAVIAFAIRTMMGG